jgi:hypothetical protein
LKAHADHLESLLALTFKTLASYTYQTRWQLEQLMEAVLANGPLRGSASKTTYGKEPTFVSLLSPALRNFNPPDGTVNLATHSRSETKEQVAIHKQRDDMFAEVEYLWLVEGKTWAKIPEEIRARMCQRMFLPPANWPWHVTVARTTERISYVRGKGKGTAESPPISAKNPSPTAHPDTTDLTDASPSKVCSLISVMCLFSVSRLCT